MAARSGALLALLMGVGAATDARAAQCDDASFDGSFDLVYTWWTNKPQSTTLQKPKAGASASTAASGRRLVENQREIMYNLRGVEKFGIINHVRLVHVMVHDTELERYGPPRDLNWSHPQLRLVSSSSVGSTGHGGYESKLASVHRIPDLHCWVLLLQDDVFPTAPFKVNALYNPETHQQVKYHADTYVQGWCGNYGPTTNHGPWFFSTCRLWELEANYPKAFSYLREHGEDIPNGSADIQCLYDNVGLSSGWAARATTWDFITVCHTNGGCSSLTYTHPHTMFTNVQGPMFSDEYGGEQNEALGWVHSFFPTPSRFELQGVADSPPTVNWTENRLFSDCRAGRPAGAKVAEGEHASSLAPSAGGGGGGGQEEEDEVPAAIAGFRPLTGVLVAAALLGAAAGCWALARRAGKRRVVLAAPARGEGGTELSAVA